MYSSARRMIPAFALSLLLAGCVTAPMTGRNQLLLVGDGEMNAMGVQAFQQVLTEEPVSKDPQKNALVSGVGRRIAQAAEQYLAGQGRPEQFAWEFVVIENDETVNAWCLPGGKVAVYTGILPVTETEDGLAVVVAHEVAHAIARHSNERMSQGLIVEMGGQALSAALQSQPQRTREMFLQAVGLGANVGVVLPFSRTQEYEADRIGLNLMAMAGYDPRASIPLWERMNSMGGPRPPEFLSTHPAPQHRIEALNQMMPEALGYYRGAAGTRQTPPAPAAAPAQQQPAPPPTRVQPAPPPPAGPGFSAGPSRSYRIK